MNQRTAVGHGLKLEHGIFLDFLDANGCLRFQRTLLN